MRKCSVAPEATPESAGKIVTLGKRFGAISPRDANGKRRPLRACSTLGEAQAALDEWRALRVVVEFLKWLGGISARPFSENVLTRPRGEDTGATLEKHPDAGPSAASLKGVR